MAQQITQTFKVFVRRDDYTGELGVSLFGCDMSEYGYIYVRDQELTIEIPDQSELVACEIDSLKKTGDRIQEDARRKLREIEDKISNLRCLEAPKGKD